MGGFGPDHPAALTARDDLRLGNIRISPALRQLTGPGGTAHVEPRVMQVLLMLIDARGAVLTREALLAGCWGNVLAGDDVLNRAIGEIRRLLRTVDDISIIIETIPRTGYRLVAPPLPEPQAVVPEPAAVTRSRRSVLVGLPVAIAGATAAAIFGSRLLGAKFGSRLLGANGQVADIEVLIASRNHEKLITAAAMLEAIVADNPEDAKAWGRLAVVRSLMAVPAAAATSAGYISQSDRAAANALALDPQQVDAIAAKAIGENWFGEWRGHDLLLQQVLELAPDHIEARMARAELLYDTGQLKAAIADLHSLQDARGDHRMLRRQLALLRWQDGETEWQSRLLPNDLSGEELAVYRIWDHVRRGEHAAAIALADRPDGLFIPNDMQPVLRQIVRALADQSPQKLHEAASDVTANAGRGHTGARLALHWLPQLGALDSAFQVAQGYLAGRGPIELQFNHSVWDGDPRYDWQRRRTGPLFSWQATPMRHDPRFDQLVTQIGLNDYWTSAAVVPDYRRRSGTADAAIGPR